MGNFNNPVSGSLQSMTDTRLLVAIPCLNEAPTIASVIRSVPRQIPDISEIHILVIDDGSTDDSAAIATAAGAEVITHEQNRGLGYTFSHAVTVAAERGYDLMTHIDGDGQFDAADIPKLLRPVIDGKADMVTASRFLDRDNSPDMPIIKRLGNAGVAGIVRLLTGKRFADVSCGFRTFSRNALLRMNLFGTFTYTQESFLDLVFKNLRIHEIPIRVRGVREFGTSRIAASLTRYATRSLKIMGRAFIAYRPFSFFGTIALFFLTVGAGLLGFLFWHYVGSGAFTPHIWAGFVGASFAFLGILTLVIAIVADMLVHMRMNQEQLLYLAKLQRWESIRGRD